MQNEDALSTDRTQADSPLAQRPRRRILRFSLATLMAIIAACCVWLAIQSNAARRQREGIALVERLGGMYTYSTPPDQVNGVAAALMLVGLGEDYVVDVDSVAIWKDASDNDVERIVEAFPKLSGLLISGELTDTALASIGKLQNLKGLNLYSKRISNHGLAGLAGCRQLGRLHLVAPVGDEGMVHLQPLSNLASLRCYSNWQFGESVEKLERQAFIECDQVPLVALLEDVGRPEQLKLELDEEELLARGIPLEAPITASHSKVSLGYALDRILSPLGLEAEITEQGARITTKQKVAAGRKRLAELQAALPNLKEVVVAW
jgi:hypothetical protein